MKKTKKGELKCEAREVRVGNFFAKVESDGMVKLTEASGLMVQRVSAMLPIGVLLSDAVDGALSGDEGAKQFLHGYCSYVYLALTVVPIVRRDEAGEVKYNFWDDMFGVLNRAADEAKAVYGVKDEPTEKEDAEALEDVRDAVELEKEVAGMAEEVGE